MNKKQGEGFKGLYYDTKKFEGTIYQLSSKTSSSKLKAVSIALGFTVGTLVLASLINWELVAGLVDLVKPAT